MPLHLLLVMYVVPGLLFASWRLYERLMAPSPDDLRMLLLFAVELLAWPAALAVLPFRQGCPDSAQLLGACEVYSSASRG
jgi:hypothetical protein